MASSSDDVVKLVASDSSESSSEEEPGTLADKPGRRIIDDYKIGAIIGKGAFSKVYEAKDKKTGEKVAVKTIRTQVIRSKLLEREINIMKTVGSHPNVLKLLAVYEEPNYLHLVMELVQGGELFDRIVAKGEYSEEDAKRIVRQMISAVQHLHATGVAHRDLKPQNILVSDNDSIKICDFGLSKMYDNGDAQFVLETCCGSPEYVAPEVLDCKPYDKSVDIWAIGVITYVLLTGCFPFWDKQHARLYEKIRKVEYIWPTNSLISPQARHLVSHLLVRTPEQRYTANECMEHPWLSGSSRRSIRRLPSYQMFSEQYKAVKRVRREQKQKEKAEKKASAEHSAHKSSSGRDSPPLTKAQRHTAVKK